MKRFLRILFLTTSISLIFQGCEEDTDNPLTTDDTCSTLQTVIDNLPEEQTQAECETSYTALQEWCSAGCEGDTATICTDSSYIIRC